MRFTIPGAPQGKARPKVTRNGNFTPRKTREYEELVRAVWRQSGSERFPDGEPLEVLIAAYYPAPKSATKSNRFQMLLGKIRPTKKPDWDNIGKIVCDALNGLAYKDDAQIVRGTVAKFYSEAPRVEVCIREAKHG